MGTIIKTNQQIIWFELMPILPTKHNVVCLTQNWMRKLVWRWMVGPMKSKQSEILNGCGKYVPDKSLNFLRMDVESMWLQLKPFVLLSNILFLDLLLHPFSLVPWETHKKKINSRHFTQMDGWPLLSFIQSPPKTAWAWGPDEPSMA